VAGYYGLTWTSLDFRVETPGEEDLQRFIGGEGLGIKYLYDGVPAHADALGPEKGTGHRGAPLAGAGG